MAKKIILLLLVCVLFCGCEIKKPGEETQTNPLVTEVPGEPQPYPVIIGGVTIDNPPQKVVCLSPALMEILFEMGYGELVIGRGSYCDFPSEISPLPDIGSSASPDIEKIIDLKPELIITASPIADKDLFAMEQNGIKSLIIPSPKNISEFLNIYQAFGFVFEGLFIGKEVGETAFSEISKAFDNREVVDLGNFIYITENFNIATGDTFESAIFSCFGTNIALYQTGYEFDYELLIHDQPNFILVNDKFSMDDLKSDNNLSELTAFNEGRVIFVDNTFFERPSSRIIDTISDFINEYKKL